MNQEFQGGKILLGVTGGIAAYKAAELASLLTQRGHAVRVVMTAHAREFVGPITFAALTGQPVPDDPFDPAQEAAISHIELARWAQLVLVAPGHGQLPGQGGPADWPMTCSPTLILGQHGAHAGGPGHESPICSPSGGAGKPGPAGGPGVRRFIGPSPAAPPAGKKAPAAWPLQRR